MNFVETWVVSTSKYFLYNVLQHFHTPRNAARLPSQSSPRSSLLPLHLQSISSLLHDLRSATHGLSHEAVGARESG